MSNQADLPLAKPLLLLLVLIWCVLGIATWRDDGTAQPGVHSDVPGMQIGGDRAVADQELRPWGAAFAGLGFMLLLMAIWMGADASRNRSVRPYLIGLAIPILLVVAAIFVVDSSASDDKLPTFWGGFPTATSLVVYGVWIVPTSYCLLFGLGYNRWFAVELMDQGEALPDADATER